MESLRQWKPKKPSRLGEDMITLTMLLIVVAVLTWGQYAS